MFKISSLLVATGAMLIATNANAQNQQGYDSYQNYDQQPQSYLQARPYQQPYQRVNQLNGALKAERFYVGGDFGYQRSFNTSKFKHIEDTANVLSVYGGYNFNETVAFELGYFQTSKELKNLIETKEYGYYGDFILKNHLRKNTRTLFTVGLENSKVELRDKALALTHKSSEIAPRLGLGLEFDMNRNATFRVMSRYVFSKHDDNQDRLRNGKASIVAGVNYAF